MKEESSECRKFKEGKSRKFRETVGGCIGSEEGRTDEVETIEGRKYVE
jgi:hypothetical protein